MNYKTKVKQILNFLDGLYSFKGKIGRKFYATRMLALVLITSLSLFLLSALSSSLSYFSGFFGLLGLILYCLHIYGLFGLQARRIRDLGWSPYWLILFPWFGLIMIILFLLKSGENK